MNLNIFLAYHFLFQIRTVHYSTVPVLVRYQPVGFVPRKKIVQVRLTYVISSLIKYVRTGTVRYRTFVRTIEDFSSYQTNFTYLILSM